MKTLSISVILVFACLFAYSQIPRAEFKAIPKRTKVIYVETGKTPEANFKLVINTLLDAGFDIDKTDKEYGIITTEYKPLPRVGNYKLRLRITDKIVVSGTLLSGISIEMYGVRSEDSPEAIEKINTQKGVYGIAFTEMYKLSKKLGEISY